MRTARYDFAACVFDKFIFVVGGWTRDDEYEEDAVDTVERYDVERDRRDFLTPMWERRSEAGISVVNNKLYVLGGSERWDRPHDSIEVYSPEDDTWAVVGQLPTARSNLAAATITHQGGPAGGLGGIRID